MPNPDLAWNRAEPLEDSGWRRFTASLPMRTALIGVAAVWLLGAVWSFTEQSAFAANKGFSYPHLLPLVIDGFAVAMAGVAWAASLDARPAVAARLATVIAVAASSASNGAWAYLRTNHDLTAVVLGVAVPVAANLAFEVLLAEMRRQVQRRRGLPPPVAIPYPRLIRLGLAPFRTFVEWRALVLDLTKMDLITARAPELTAPPSTEPSPSPAVPATAVPTPPAAPPDAVPVRHEPAARERVEHQPARHEPVVREPVGIERVRRELAQCSEVALRDPAPQEAGHQPNGHESNGHVSNGRESNGLQSNGLQSNGLQSNGLQSNGLQSNGLQSNGHQSSGHQSSGHQSNGRESNGRESNGRESNGRESNGHAGRGQSAAPAAQNGQPAARRRDLEAVPAAPPPTRPPARTNTARRTVDPRVELLAAHLASTEDAGEFTGEMVGPLLNIDVAPRTGRRLLGLARELVIERSQGETDPRDDELSAAIGSG